MLAVVGAGAVGSLLASLLHRQGHGTVLVATERSARLLGAHGLEVDSVRFGRWSSDVPVTTTIPPGAPVLLAIKAPHLPSVVPALRAAAPPAVTCLQNGIDHPDRLRRALGPRSVVTGASVYVEAQRHDPTAEREPVRLAHRSPFLRLRLPAGTPAPYAGPLVEQGVQVDVGGDERAVLWEKFQFLAPMALLTAYHRRPLGPAVEADPALADAVLREVAALATLSGAPVTAARLADRLAAMPATMRSSLQHDLAAGRPDELDAIGGALLRVSAAAGVPAAAVTAVVQHLAGSRRA